MDTTLCSVDDCDQPRAKHRTVCRPHSRKTYTVACAHCGTETQKDQRRERPQFCTFECRDLWLKANERGRFGPDVQMVPPPGLPKGYRRPLRAAYEDGDWPAFLNLIQRRTNITERGCWEWMGTIENGYPLITIGLRDLRVHRLVLEAKHGKSLGSQAAHHACANTICVNPNHLQPVTAAANNAEMMARTYMVRRIQDLEAALHGLAPSHPLLNEIGVAEVA